MSELGGPAASDSGEVSDFKGADALLADLLEEIEKVPGNWGYDCNKIRQVLADRNIVSLYSVKKEPEIKAAVRPASM